MKGMESLYYETSDIGSSDEMPYELVKEEDVYFIKTFNRPAMLVLPPKPKDGFSLFVTDGFGSWRYYPLIVHRNGKAIMGMEEHLTCDVPNGVFGMKYTNTKMGWVVHDKFDLNNRKLMQEVAKGRNQNGTL
jgi:hypothetical protein